MNNFTTSAYIRKNTHELRRKLESLGYTIMDSKYETLNHKPIEEGKAIITYEGEHKIYAVVTKINKVVKAGRINCNNNEDLFLAIASLNKNNPEYYLTQCNKTIEVFHKSSVDEFINEFNSNY